MSKSAAMPGTTKRIKPNQSCDKYYIDSFQGECYFKMLEELLKQNVFDRLNIFYESNYGPGIANWITTKHLQDKVYCEVIPEIRFISEYIDDNTIIFVRGGFKHWHDLLLSYKDKSWLMLYGANTGRERWRFWDIILNDLEGDNNTIDKFGRYYFRFVKPTNENQFYFKNLPPVYDVCIGASHIHDRKGQYLVFNAIEELNSRNYKILAVMPGSPRGGEQTAKMMKKLSSVKNVQYVGFLEKNQLCEIFNISKLFVHMGNHGQNDRSIFEALACGTPIIYKSDIHHDPELEDYFLRFKHGNDHKKLADEIETQLFFWKQNTKHMILETYRKHFGMNQIVIPRMKKLFKFMFDNRPTMEAKQELTKLFSED